MDKNLPHVVILGAGPAGVGAAYQLRKTGRARVTVLERGLAVGGNAGSFDCGGQRVDFGSHRLHPACDPAILAEIESLVGSDLLKRPRHGRILLRGKWIHFPLKPIDLLLKLDRGFAFGSLFDMFGKIFSGTSSNEESFASVVRSKLGKTICRDFYFPYARKIWGREPEELSGIQAKRRVSANSFPKLLRKVLSAFPGVPKSKTSGFFYYPRRGFGQISESFAEAASSNGAEIRLGWTVDSLEHVEGEHKNGWIVTASSGEDRRELEADFVWSTIPVGILSKMITPTAPSKVLNAANSLESRAMLLIYLELPVDQFTEYDAHYFPGANVSITRLSETKNYAVLAEPKNRTTICAELPCSTDDRFWTMTDEELGELVAGDLATAGIPLPADPVSITSKRLPHAYPIYSQGYEEHFDAIDSWVSDLPQLLSYGRQGLFAHDNTHHALAMAYAAVDCLDGDTFDLSKWEKYREVFETHVVED